MRQQIRQGDVLLVPVEKVPDGLRLANRDKHNRLVLAEGEAHGHAHALRDLGVTGFLKETAERDANSAMIDYIIVGGDGADLKHEYVDGRKADHDAAKVEPGAYRVVQQREFIDEKSISAFD